MNYQRLRSLREALEGAAERPMVRSQLLPNLILKSDTHSWGPAIPWRTKIPWALAATRNHPRVTGPAAGVTDNSLMGVPTVVVGELCDSNGCGERRSPGPRKLVLPPYLAASSNIPDPAPLVSVANPPSAKQNQTAHFPTPSPTKPKSPPCLLFSTPHSSVAPP